MSFILDDAYCARHSKLPAATSQKVCLLLLSPKHWLAKLIICITLLCSPSWLFCVCGGRELIDILFLHTQTYWGPASKAHAIRGQGKLSKFSLSPGSSHHAMKLSKATKESIEKAVARAHLTCSTPDCCSLLSCLYTTRAPSPNCRGWHALLSEHHTANKSSTLSSLQLLGDWWLLHWILESLSVCYSLGAEIAFLFLLVGCLR